LQAHEAIEQLAVALNTVEPPERPAQRLDDTIGDQPPGLKVTNTSKEQGSPLEEVNPDRQVQDSANASTNLRFEPRRVCHGGPAHPYDTGPFGEHLWDYIDGDLRCARCGREQYG